MCSCLGNNDGFGLHSSYVGLSLVFGSAALLGLGPGVADTFEMAFLIAKLTNGFYCGTSVRLVLVPTAEAEDCLLMILRWKEV